MWPRGVHVRVKELRQGLPGRLGGGVGLGGVVVVVLLGVVVVVVLLVVVGVVVVVDVIVSRVVLVHLVVWLVCTS